MTITMTRMSVDKFEALLQEGNWVRTQHFNECDRHDVPRLFVEDDGEQAQEHVLEILGEAKLVSKLDGITITYTESYSYIECEPETLSHGADNLALEQMLSVEGVVVLDEDGDELCLSDLYHLIDGAFIKIDYFEFKESIVQIVDVDVDEDSDMQTYTLEIDNAPHIRFTGEEVARVSSSDDKAFGSNFSGQTGRWTVLALYKTKGGKYVCHQIGRTKWAGERDRFSGKVCETLDEVREFFGYKWLAKELYEEAGIEAVVDVD